jgi:phage terminase large subunit-like protein
VAELPPPERMPMVISLDAGVSSDIFGVVAITRHPTDPKRLALRMSRKFAPPKGGHVDFGLVKALLREWKLIYNIVEVAFDPYQLESFSREMQEELGIWFRPFPQGADRAKADRALYDLIRDQGIVHTGDPDVREHLNNANAKVDANEDSKMRLIKKVQSSKIDLAVCMSMAAAEALRLHI